MSPATIALVCLVGLVLLILWFSGVLQALLILWRTRSLPGPKAKFLFGNYFDLIARGWLNRAKSLKLLHEEYGEVFCLWQPFPCPPIVVTSLSVPEADVLDSVRVESSMVEDSIMSIPDNARYREKLEALQFLKEGEQWTRFETIVKKWAKKLPAELLGRKDLRDAILKGEVVPLEEDVLKIWTLRLVVDWLVGVEVLDDEADSFIENTDHFIDELMKRTHQPVWMWYTDYARWETYIIAMSGIKALTTKWKAASPVIKSFTKEQQAPLSLEEVTFMLMAAYSTTSIALHSCFAGVASKNDLEVTIMEILAKEPTVPFSSKIMVSDMQIGSFTVPKGCRLMRLKTIACPVRPFGGGNRRCFGQRFAVHIIREALAEVRANCSIMHLPAEMTPERTVRRSLSRSNSGPVAMDHGVHLLNNSSLGLSPLSARKSPLPSSPKTESATAVKKEF